MKCNKEILIYIIYVFTIPFISVLLMSHVSMFQSGVGNLILYGIEGASPAIAAMLVSIHNGGTKNLKHFLKVNYKENRNIGLCITAFLIPAIVLTIAKGLLSLFTNHNSFVVLPSPRKMLIILWALIAEELGWRGFLQPKINQIVNNTCTPFIVGVIWSLWHYHFWISGSMDVPIIIFLYGCIAESYGYYIITKVAKDNIIPASIWHFSGNLFFNLYLFNPNWNDGSVMPYLLVNLFYSFYILVFILGGYREKHQ